MTFFVNREGNLSVIRVGAVLAIVGVLVIAGGLIVFSFEQASFQGPLNIDPPPGAVDWGVKDISRSARSVYFQVPGQTPEEVVAYYQQKALEYYGSDPTNLNVQCTRIPQEGNFPDYREDSGLVPYYYTCMFERSGFRLLQYTRVIIQPGVYNEDPAQNTEGMTVVEHEQQWQS